METVLQLAETLLGATILLAIGYDVFQSVLVPRRSGRRLRLAPLLVARLWQAWRWQALRMLSTSRREDFLGMFAPFALVCLLLYWVLALLVGFALVLLAHGQSIHPPIEHFSTAWYLAGTSLLTIGFGDLVPTSFFTRAVLVSAALSGLTVLALVLSLIFSLHAAFGRREVYVLTLDARAGSPPSGVALLETFAQFKMIDALPAMFNAWELWCADMLQSHVAFPVLPYFRSVRADQSWVSSLGAVLDAGTLLLTTVDLDNAARDGSCRTSGLRGAASMTYTLGSGTVNDLVELFQNQLVDWQRSQRAGPSIHDVLVDRSEFDAVADRLDAAGFRLVDRDRAWSEFIAHRATYATGLNALAKHLAAPPAQWIGNRSAIPRREVPVLPAAAG